MVEQIIVVGLLILKKNFLKINNAIVFMVYLHCARKEQIKRIRQYDEKYLDRIEKLDLSLEGYREYLTLTPNKIIIDTTSSSPKNTVKEILEQINRYLKR